MIFSIDEVVQRASYTANYLSIHPPDTNAIESTVEQIRFSLNLKTASTPGTNTTLSEDGSVVETCVSGSSNDADDVLVKDCIGIEGVEMTAGSRSFRHQSLSNADIVEQIKEAEGYRVYGTGNMDAFAYGITGTESELGAVKNPYKKECIPGGSSSGCAAAIANGAVQTAIATDTGGSTRIPAACCGVTGLKPTSDSLSRGGVLPLSPSFDSLGVLAPTLSDVVDFYLTLANKSLPNSDEIRYTLGIPERPNINKQINIDDISSNPIVRHIKQISLTPPDFSLDHLQAAYSTIVASELYQVLTDDLTTINPNSIRDSFRNTLRQTATAGYQSQVLKGDFLIFTGLNLASNGKAYSAANAIIERFNEHIDDVFRRVDVLYLPALACEVPSDPPPKETIPKLLRYIIIANTTDSPSIVLPDRYRLSSSAPMQLIAQSGEDTALLHAATELLKTEENR